MSNTEGPNPDPKPDLVVGVDFGMTGTAVAWAVPSADVVNSITTWPGKDDSTVEAPKAPSAICLSAPNGQTAWGFEAFAEDIAKTSVRRLFKPWLDEDFATLAEALRGPNDADAEISKEEEEEEEEDVGDEHGIQHENIRMDVSKAEECLRQYLLGLHDYIRKYMYEHLPTLKWLSAAIWFQFSYPATWDLTTQKRFKRIVESAGFSQGKKHRVSALSLNEAEAAMVSFFVEETRRSAGETILTADLGGCTTDMSTFEITGDDGKKVALQVSDSDARYNGSLKIDGAIRRELYPTIQQEIATMSAFRHLSAGEKKRHAQAEVRRILREERNYITAKHGFKPDTKTCKVLLGLKNQKGEPVSKLKVDLIKALRKALNEQCDAVWSQIEGQIEAQPKPDSLGCLVLTGGVSNNKYIQARLRKEANENYHQTEVMVPETPELAVSRGLVHETLESINRCSVFRYESSFFYGVVVSTENNMPTKLVSKGKVISTKDFKKKKSVTLPTMSHDTKIWLVRWSEKNGPRNNEEVGCLTEDLPALWTWKRATFGKDLTTEIEVRFDRRTILITLTGDGGKSHKCVFNEAWHKGAVPPVRRKRDHPIIKPLLALIGPMVALAGLTFQLVMNL